MLQKYCVESSSVEALMPTAPFFFGDLGELVGDDIFLGLGLGIFEGLLERRQLGRVLADALAVLGVVGGVGGLDFGERDLLGGIVGGADLVGALEGDVLEHVGEAAGALRVVRRAGVDQRVEAEDRSLGPLADDQREAVGQDLDGGALLEAGEILRLCPTCQSYRNGYDRCNPTSYSYQAASKTILPRV